jgi:hypothetical protein
MRRAPIWRRVIQEMQCIFSHKRFFPNVYCEIIYYYYFILLSRFFFFFACAFPVEPPVKPNTQTWGFRLYLLLCAKFLVRLFCCKQSIECFPNINSRYIIQSLITIPVAPMIICTAKHFIFHILRIYILKFLYFNLFYVSFCVIIIMKSLTHATNIIFKS